MLGSPTRSLDEIYERLREQAFSAEFKYDGQRAQIHAENVEGRIAVKIFSRHLEDMTDKVRGGPMLKTHCLPLWLAFVVLILGSFGYGLLSTGLTDIVQWDNYSLLLKGQRVFLQYVWLYLYWMNFRSDFPCSSGEFHTFRLPVPGLWLDILQKAKAMGLNAVSVYAHCKHQFP